MQSNNADHLDSTLAAVALLTAYIDGDEDGVDAVLSEQADQAAILSSLLFMFKDVLTKVTGGQPHKVLDVLRSKLIARMAQSDGQES